MTIEYKIIMGSKNEGVTYKDYSGDFHFDIELRGKTWTIFLPGTKGSNHRPYQLNSEESERILPRIKSYFESIKWFGFIPMGYATLFVEKSNTHSE